MTQEDKELLLKDLVLILVLMEDTLGDNEELYLEMVENES